MASTNNYIVLPDSGFSKDGYILSGWMIDNVEYSLGDSYNLTADATAYAIWSKKVEVISVDDTSVEIQQQTITPIASYTIDATGYTTSLQKTKFPYHYSYSSYGVKNARFSNNVSSIVVRGDGSDSISSVGINGIEDQLLSVRLHSNLVNIGPSCFAECTKLDHVDANSTLSIIDDYAFYNCKSLSSLPFLANSDSSLAYIGNYAFAKSGLKSVKLNVKRSVSDAAVNGYCFASCENLLEFEALNSPFLGYGMFQNCIKLSSVTLANYHSYVYPYCFSNCTSLARIDFPSNFQNMSDHMFDGCMNLREVTFPSNSILNQIGDYVFANCPNLTSLTLPVSISSFDMINSKFLASSNIKKIVFLGMSTEQLGTVSQYSQLLQYSYDTWYWKTEDIKGVLNVANKNHIPIICGTGLATCSRCEGVFGYNVDSETISYSYTTKKGKTKIDKDAEKLTIDVSGIDFKKHKDFNNEDVGKVVLNHKYLFVFGIQNRIRYKNGIDTFYDSETYASEKIGDGQWYTPSTFLYWNKPDGTIYKYSFKDGDRTSTQQYISKIQSALSGYSPEGSGTETSAVISEKLNTFGLGSGLSVEYVSNTGVSFICTNDSVNQLPVYRVDNYTTDDFRYGIWYYNAKELKQFVDDNHIPALMERSSEGCGPCQNFKRTVWSNSTFQSEIAKRKCMFCRVEIGALDSFFSPTDTVAYFVSHKWGHPNTYIPELLFYWNTGKKDEDGNDIIYEEDWNYNHYTDPANANYQTILNKIDAMLASYSYEPDEQYDAPKKEEDDYGLIYYENEISDENGRFFVCDKKTSVKSFSSDKLSIDDIPESSADLIESSYYTGTSILSSLEVGQKMNCSTKTGFFATNDNLEDGIEENGVIFKIDEQAYYDGCRVWLSSDGSTYYRIDDDGNISSTAATSDDVDYQNEIEYLYEFQNYSETDFEIDDSNEYESGKLHEMNDNTSYDSIQNIATYAATYPTKTLVLFEVDSSSEGQSLSSLLESSEFVAWAKSKEYLFVAVESDKWTSNAPQAAIDFEQSVVFKDNVPGSNIPKILVFNACINCGWSECGYGQLESRHAIYYSSDHDMDYYASLIETYAQIQDDQ